MRRLLPAAAAAVTLLGGLAFAASRHPAASSGAAANPVPPASPGSPAGTPGQGQLQALRVSLTGLRWYDYYGVELPVSVVAGPRYISGGL